MRRWGGHYERMGTCPIACVAFWLLLWVEGKAFGGFCLEVRYKLTFYPITQVVVSKPDFRKTEVDIGRCIRRVLKLFI